MDAQFVANTIYSFLVLSVVACSFFVVFKPSKYFHISHAAAIVLAPYVFEVMEGLGVGLVLSVLAALCAASAFGVSVELGFYRRFADDAAAGIKILVLSLGVYIIAQNTLSFAFGDQILLMDPCAGCLRHIVEESSIRLSGAQVLTAIASILILSVLVFLWYRTGFGRAARCVSEDRDLARVIGVDVNGIILSSVLIGSLVAGAVGLLVGCETGVTPVSGFPYLLYGIIAVIIGGNESLAGTIAGALALALIQSATSYYIDSRWASTVAYLLLIIFLIVRPEGVRTLSLAMERR